MYLCVTAIGQEWKRIRPACSPLSIYYEYLSTWPRIPHSMWTHILGAVQRTSRCVSLASSRKHALAPGAWHTTKPCSYSHIAHTHKFSWSPVGVQRRPSSCGTSFLWYNALPFVASLGGSCSLRGFPWSVLAALFCVHELAASSLLRSRVQELWFSCW